MTGSFALCLPNTNLLNTLAGAGLLDLLLVDRHSKLVLIDVVEQESRSRSPSIDAFLDRHADRIVVAKTSIGQTLRQFLRHGLPRTIMHAAEQAIYEFIAHGLSELAIRGPVLTIHDGMSLRTDHLAVVSFGRGVRFMTFADYLRDLESQCHIASSDAVWQQLLRVRPDLEH